MPAVNAWPVERNVGTCNWRPPLHLLLLLRLLKAVGGEVGVGIGKNAGKFVVSWEKGHSDLACFCPLAV